MRFSAVVAAITVSKFLSRRILRNHSPATAVISFALLCSLRFHLMITAMWLLSLNTNLFH